MGSEQGRILPLAEVCVADAHLVGSKAARLGELRRAGFPIPDGFVVVGEPDDEIAAASARLGDGPWAVRSSALAEDLADASFAGQYETFLDIKGLDALRQAIVRCRESASSLRVARYQAARGGDAGGAVAVLVQRMVPADAAGVAFTANPVTGDRSEVLVSAVPGLGERLVGGEATPEEWTVRGSTAVRRAGVANTISAAQALAVADLAQRVAERFGEPQDIEWAIAGGELSLLQSRPMTALPEPVDWTPPRPRGLRPPGPAYWMRNFRLGEWLSDPVSPLFEDWLLRSIDAGFRRAARAESGLAAALGYAVVNGWLYSTPELELAPRTLLVALTTHPISTIRMFVALTGQIQDPELADHRFFRRVVTRWHEETRPRLLKLIVKNSERVDQAPLGELPAVVDELGLASGEAFWALVVGGGSAWKVEVALARFCHEHLAGVVGLDVSELLAGLAPADGGDPASTPHAVLSADWRWPTLGELGLSSVTEGWAARRQPLEGRRRAIELACQQALAGTPELARRFDILLGLAQEYARLREEQAGSFTLAWPALRSAVGRLSDAAVERGGIADREDAFFLTRSELVEVATGRADRELPDRVIGRRAQWDHQRRLVAPLTLGRMPKLVQRSLGALEILRSEAPASEGALHGEPASPGRASGPVRIVRGPEDFERFRPDEVLVARATAPAWTPLFNRAVAVVTDSGSLAAHASLVAREFGIPAVVATGDATARLHDGQHVIVDGSAGRVEVLQ